MNGASVIRLDAIPYLWKQLGTSCVHLPQTHELIKLFHDVFEAVAPHVLLLTETNVPHKENMTYVGNRGDEAQIIYNFTLPPLILWSLHKEDATILARWAGTLRSMGARATYLNITATHDGIGMRPSEGILSDEQRNELIQLAFDHGGDITGKRNADGSMSVYELNLNWFDAVNDPGADEPPDIQIRRFMLTQSIVMTLIGIPAIYIHSLVGSRNDLAGVKRTGKARSINREQLRLHRLRQDLADPSTHRHKVFAETMRLLDIRASQTAFHPNAGQVVLGLGSEVFALRRHNETTGHSVIALHNVTGRTVDVDLERAGLAERSRDLLTGETARCTISLAPYQAMWLTPCG